MAGALRLTCGVVATGTEQRALAQPCRQPLLPRQLRTQGARQLRVAALQRRRTAPAPHRCRRRVAAAAQPSETAAAADSGTTQDAAKAEAVAAGISSNGAELPEGELNWQAPGGGRRFLTSLALLRALPWRKFKKGSTLVIELGGAIGEQKGGRFSSPVNLPTICEALHKAALDPRVDGIYFKLSPLQAGWAKLAEVRRHIEAFNASGKWTVAWMSQGGEKEYYLASACKEVYVAPNASFTLRGFKVAGTFLRGVLDKVGVTPELVRIGKYKSAGDQLLRRDMSEAQAEQLNALLDDIYSGFVSAVSASKGKTAEEVKGMLDEAWYDQKKYLEGGWVSGLKYEDEVQDLLRERTGGKKNEKTGLWKGPPKAVGLKKYASVSPSAFGLNKGKKRIAVVRAGGAIVGGSGGGSPLGGGQTIVADAVIAQLRRVEKDKGVAAVVLRVDSPGGDALASDLMWAAIKRVRRFKPVIASFGDVSASGGYYMGMACSRIVAEALTITGSIGVISGKFSLKGVYEKIGYGKTTLARGRWAKLEAEEKEFTEDEAAYFDGAAHFAYESFRNKAAESRGMEVAAMQERAQGRVWSGRAALGQGLIDALGGVSRAVAVAKQEAGLGQDERVRVQELSREKASPLAVLSGGGASANVSSPAAALGLLQLAWLALTQPQAVAGGGLPSLLPLAGGGGGSSLGALLPLDPTRPLALMPDVQVDGAYSASLLSGSGIGNSAEADLLRRLL